MTSQRQRVVDALETVGISPKVKLPAGALFAIGVVLLVLSLVLGDDTLWKIGVTLIGASGVNLGLGYRADPGQVKIPA